MSKSTKYKGILLCMLIVIASFSSVLFGQERDRDHDREKQEKRESNRKIFFGGNFALMIGTVTNIEISPLVGYRFTPRLSAGTGITYAYYRERFTGFNTYETHIYGGRIFGSWLAIKDLKETIGLPGNGGVIGYTEYEALNMDDNYKTTLINTGGNQREWFHNVYVGGGYRQPIGRNASFNILILWNLNQSPKLPYDNPTIRVGFYF
ncbi:MAG TPA: hypothetical protein PLC81_00605 [Bacteroidales bacterium]|mgnify:FL=1|nr:hypothetical protein [Bacteroidales bacterium]